MTGTEEAFDGWQAPPWQLPLERATLSEIFRVPGRSPIEADVWPDDIWPHVCDCQRLDGAASTDLLNAFADLPVSDPARCHMPPWGLAAYADNELLFTATLCFECDNAVVDTPAGSALRAFDSASPAAQRLRSLLQSRLPLDRPT